eukprot:4776406-Pyramimonas_sp.AAC.1
MTSCFAHRVSPRALRASGGCARAPRFPAISGESARFGNRRVTLRVLLACGVWQSGVQYSVLKRFTDDKSGVRIADFNHVEPELSFPRLGRRDGENPTPPHASGDFKWK